MGTFIAKKQSKEPLSARPKRHKMERNEKKPARVAIVGPDQISATDLYSLVVGGFIEEVVLIGKGSRRLIKDLDELKNVVAFPHNVRAWAGHYQDAASAEVAIMTFGAHGAKSHQANKAFVRGSAMRLKDAGFGGVILVARDPVNMMAKAALEGSGFPGKRIIGIGTGHIWDKSGRVIWCTALNSDVTFMDNCNADCPYFEQVLGSPGVVHPSNRKLRSYLPQNVAACVTQVCEAVIKDTHNIIPVFAEGADGQFLDMPCAIGRNGIEQIVKVPNGRSSRATRSKRSTSRRNNTNSSKAA